MMTKKYELIEDDTVTTPDGRTLYRIRALIDIVDRANAGDLGGYVESEKNLSHNGNAWVFGDARIFGDAQAYGNARVSDKDCTIRFSNVGSEYRLLIEVTLSRLGINAPESSAIQGQ